jgi:hypothetical protein
VNYTQASALSILQKPSFAYMPISRMQGNPWRVFTKQPDPEKGVGNGMEYLKVDATFDPLYSCPDLGFLWSAAVA